MAKVKLKFSIIVFSLILSLFSIFYLFPSKIYAANYPNSSIQISTGDVLYSSKGWQTFFVGHVAVVGDDGKIYHSTPAVSTGGVGDTLTTYLSRWDPGSTFTVYKFKPDQYGPFLEPYNAGKWARNNVGSINNYSFTSDLQMSNIATNYCSKFIWQAYYYGANTNIDRPYLGNYMSGSSSTIWTPADFKASPVLKSVGSFTN
ncbi:hypothetical protein D3C81_924210 [compost metagenome]